jgi:prepilin-type N-terminal cleavage/methylation domain-containing protein
VLRRAFTAIELTVVLGVVAILSAIAMPPATKLLDRIQVRAAVTEIESVFAAARHIAIARGEQSTVQIDTAAKIIFVTVDADTVRRAHIGAEHGVSMVSNRASTVYSATGLGYGAANLSIVVRKGSALDTIVVSRLGRVRH